MRNESRASDLTLERVEELMAAFQKYKQRPVLPVALEDITARLVQREGRPLAGQENYIMAAPDLMDRMRRLPEAVISMPGAVFPAGTVWVHGLPICETGFLPPGYWMRWEGGVPVEMGRVTEPDMAPAAGGER